MANKTEAKTVKIKLPYIKGVLEDDLFVGDNGKRYLIKRGEWADVPESVAEILAMSENLEKEAAERAERLQDQVGAAGQALA